jgi:8-oxo-dGTP diphosphatase
VFSKELSTYFEGLAGEAILKREITKIGLAVMDGDRVLLVKKRGSEFLILPGGKPEKSETDVQALSRELDEELGCRLVSDQVSFLGTFSDEAAGMPGIRVTIRLYGGAMVGTPVPNAEIESIVWWDATEHVSPALAPSLKNSILPFLRNSLSGLTQPQVVRKSASSL